MTTRYVAKQLANLIWLFYMLDSFELNLISVYHFWIAGGSLAVESGQILPADNIRRALPRALGTPPQTDALRTQLQTEPIRLRNTFH